MQLWVNVGPPKKQDYTHLANKAFSLSDLDTPRSDSRNTGSTNNPRDDSTPDPFESCGDSKGWPVVKGKCDLHEYTRI